MNRLQCEGIVIYKEDYSEADIRIVVLTNTNGLINFYIKGIRKTKKRDVAAVDILAYSKLNLIRKNDTYNIQDIELLKDFSNIKKDLDKLYLSIYLLDIIKKILVEEDCREKEFLLLKNTLDYMENQDKKEKQLLVVAFFLFRIIKFEGVYFNSINNFFQDKKESDFLEEKEILKKFIENRVKDIGLEELNEKVIFRLILLLEDYINNQLEINLNIREILIKY
ncbi:MAG: DNA repair protein RecO [Fusobacteriaceae bacterium]